MIRLSFLFMCIGLIANPAHATKVQEVTSEKGLTAWLVEEHSLPLVSVRIAFTDSGNIYDPDGKEGRANMAAALLMEGAGELNSLEFSEALENHAIEMNTGVDEDYLNAKVESLSEYKDKAFYYLGLALTKPRFDNSAVARVKKQTKSIILKQQSRPGYLLHRAWQEMVYKDHPYGKPALGTNDTVDDIDSDDFETYRERYLTKENIIISVVGDITPDELRALLDEHLAALPDKYDPETTIKEAALPVTPQTKIVEFNVPQTMITFGTHGIKRSDPHYIEAYVMNHILGGGGTLTAKLGQEIREKRGLAYSVFSYLNPMTHTASWQGGFATRNEQVKPALEVLKTTLADFVKHGPTNKEFQSAKDYLKGSFVLNLDSNSEIASFLNVMQIHNLGKDYFEKRNALIDDVTKADVEDMARKLADPEKLLVVMVGKPVMQEKEAE
ncbi:MAG: M16 family metallopeptidase [Rickettsiales bacterium]